MDASSDPRQWARQLAEELLGRRHEQWDVFQDLPDELLARFLEGRATESERAELIAIAERNPELRGALDNLQTALAAPDVPPAEIPPVPPPVFVVEPRASHASETVTPRVDGSAISREQESLVSSSDSADRWSRVAAELRDYRNAQRAAWGDVDELTVARYLAGECRGTELKRVESAIQSKPSLRECVETIREVVGPVKPLVRPTPLAWFSDIRSRIQSIARTEFAGEFLRPRTLWLAAATIVFCVSAIHLSSFFRQSDIQVASLPPNYELKWPVNELTEFTRASACPSPSNLEAPPPTSPNVSARHLDVNPTTRDPLGRIVFVTDSSEARYRQESDKEPPPDVDHSAVRSYVAPVTSSPVDLLTERTRVFLVDSKRQEARFEVYPNAKLHLIVFRLVAASSGGSAGTGIGVEFFLHSIAPSPSSEGGCRGWPLILWPTGQSFVVGFFGSPAPDVGELDAQIRGSIGRTSHKSIREAAKTAEQVLRKAGGDPLTIELRQVHAHPAYTTENYGPAPTPMPKPSAVETPLELTTAGPIKGFRVLESGVATGSAPTTVEAIEWLKAEGFKTVVNLLPEDQADPAEGPEVRRSELKYVSLPITPETINAETVDKFNQLMDDASRHPIFVHDSNGRLTGAMWYLHLALVDKVSDDSARRQAARIGLTDPRIDSGTATLWIAILEHELAILTQSQSQR